MLAPYIIKPEGLRYSSEIHKIFEENGLKIVNYKTIQLSKKFLRTLYKNLAPPIQKCIERILINEFVELGLVEGKGAQRKLYKLCGTKKTQHFVKKEQFAKCLEKKKAFFLQTDTSIG